MVSNAQEKKRRIPKGRVVTFYSYKGGTGRSMALANVAWMLAMGGERVLVIDWDLEAPGIHRFFHPFLEDKELLSTNGLLDFVEMVAGRSAVSTQPLAADEVDVLQFVKILRWPANSPVQWSNFGSFAGIELLVAGRQGPTYGERLNKFNWIDFYEKLDGRRLLGLARQQLRGIYDYVLIDSRTGVSDTSGICTIEMPDSVVACFTLNDQSIKGASGVVESIVAQRKVRRLSKVSFATSGSSSSIPMPEECWNATTDANSRTLQPALTDVDMVGPLPLEPEFRVFPVPTRVEIVSERTKREVALSLAQQNFYSFIDHLMPELQSRYWLRVQLPYFPFYAFEEIPAVFGDPANDELSLSTPLKHIARYVSDDPDFEVVPLAKDDAEAERLRKIILNWYTRKGDAAPEDAVQLAQSFYDGCDRTQRVLLQRVMLRLVQVNEKSAPSLATVPLEDFESQEKGTVQALARAGLVQFPGSSACLADKSLPEGWELLKQWLTEEAEFLLWRQRLSASARSWRNHGLDESALLRGPLLSEAVRWMQEHTEDLNQTELDFITAGQRVERKVTSANRRGLRLRIAGSMLALVIVLSVTLLVVWYFKRSTSDSRAAAMMERQYAMQQEAMLKQSQDSAAKLEYEIAELKQTHRDAAEATTKTSSAPHVQTCRLYTGGPWTWNPPEPPVAIVAIDGPIVGRATLGDKETIMPFLCQPGEHSYYIQFKFKTHSAACKGSFLVETAGKYKLNGNVHSDDATCSLQLMNNRPTTSDSSKSPAGAQNSPPVQTPQEIYNTLLRGQQQKVTSTPK